MLSACGLALTGPFREHILSYSLSTVMFSLEISFLLLISDLVLRRKMSFRKKIVLFLLSLFRWPALGFALYLLIRFGYLDALGMAGGALTVSIGVAGAGIGGIVSLPGKEGV